MRMLFEAMTSFSNRQSARDVPTHYFRSKSIDQLTSHVTPPSVENACCHLAEIGVMSDQMKRTRIGRPSNVSSHSNVPTPFEKPPTTGVSISATPWFIHQIDHSPV